MKVKGVVRAYAIRGPEVDPRYVTEYFPLTVSLLY